MELGARWPCSTIGSPFVLPDLRGHGASNGPPVARAASDATIAREWRGGGWRGGVARSWDEGGGCVGTGGGGPGRDARPRLRYLAPADPAAIPADHRAAYLAAMTPAVVARPVRRLPGRASTSTGNPRRRRPGCGQAHHGPRARRHRSRGDPARRRRRRVAGVGRCGDGHDRARRPLHPRGVTGRTPRPARALPERLGPVSSPARAVGAPAETASATASTPER